MQVDVILYNLKISYGYAQGFYPKNRCFGIWVVWFEYFASGVE